MPDLDNNCSNFTIASPLGPKFLVLCNEQISEMSVASEFPMFLQVIALIVGVPVITLGLIGNMLTLLILQKTTVLQTPANVFLLSLSLSDIFHCTIVIPIQIAVYMHSSWPFSDTFCNIYPFLNLTFVGATMGCLSATALGRHFKIIYPRIYARYFDKRSKTTTIIFFCWILPILFQIPPLFGVWGEFGYEEKLLTCALLRGEDTNGTYGTFFIFSTLVIPISIILFSYLRIFCVVRANHRRIQIMRQSELTMIAHQDSQQKTAHNHAHREDIRFTKMMMCIFLVCIVSYFPYLIVNMTDRNVDNIVAISIASICVWFSACLNPVVYVLMNRPFRKAFMKLLPRNYNYPFEVTQ